MEVMLCECRMRFSFGLRCLIYGYTILVFWMVVCLFWILEDALFSMIPSLFDTYLFIILECESLMALSTRLCIIEIFCDMGNVKDNSDSVPKLSFLFSFILVSVRSKKLILRLFLCSIMNWRWLLKLLKVKRISSVLSFFVAKMQSSTYLLYNKNSFFMLVETVTNISRVVSANHGLVQKPMGAPITCL